MLMHGGGKVLRDVRSWHLLLVPSSASSGGAEKTESESFFFCAPRVRDSMLKPDGKCVCVCLWPRFNRASGSTLNLSFHAQGSSGSLFFAMRRMEYGEMASPSGKTLMCA